MKREIDDRPSKFYPAVARIPNDDNGLVGKSILWLPRNASDRHSYRHEIPHSMHFRFFIFNGIICSRHSAARVLNSMNGKVVVNEIFIPLPPLVRELAS